MEAHASPRRNEEFVPLPVKFCLEMESEEDRMIHQAKLARWLKSETEMILLGKVPSRKSAPLKTRERYKKKEGRVPFDLPKQKHEEYKVMKLTYVRIQPKEGEEFLGILEAHENRFVCECLGFHMVIMHAYLESCFMRLGDMKMPPLLHFHLRHTVKVGTIETKDIQVHLMPHDFKKGKQSVDDPLNFEKYEESLRSLQNFKMYLKSGVTSDTNDSYFRKMIANEDIDYIVKFKQAWNNSRNEDLKNFAHEVQQRPQSCDSVQPIHFHALEEFEIFGDVGTPFALTYGALVLLKKVPFSVILVQDIEIVNLARLEHGRIDMTVIFKDYERDVLEIRSIPLESLTGIKHRLHFGAVKYYVNEVSKDWNMLLKDIRQSPKEFIDSGGWGSPKLGLEDPLTLTYYKDSDSDSDSDSEW